MYKYCFIFLLFTLSLFSCGPDIDEGEPIKSHEKLTIESNLKFIHIDQFVLDSTVVYPYVLLDSVFYSGGSFGYTLYPVKDSGYIKFKYYDSYGQVLGPVQFRDSLLINTPVDTTIIVMSGFSSTPRLYIYH